ncbi:hypothetical protein B0H12DRAFT_1118770 [Mycena haematopus]|nr:hypothetical protein B0H12DRAFT_1118770 [Mycena haematopus]
MAFRKEDWDRLKKIAEGNPDEEKIGAFGVVRRFLVYFTSEDHYSTCFVAEWMGFYWKDDKDQLFARRGPLPPNTTDNPSNVWTSFEMPLRQPAPVPRLVRLRKESGVPKPLDIPKGLRNRSQTMTVTGVNSTSLRIQADTMRWVYSSGTAKPKPLVFKQEKTPTSTFFNLKSWLGSNTPQRVATPLPPEPEEVVDPFTINETSVSLSIFSAEVDVHLDKKVAAELQRSTKKNPPNKVKYQLIYGTAKDEYDASKKEDEQQPFATGSIFQGLRADIDGVHRACHWSDNRLGGHMAARFIPTVERESIDLMDRNVAMWNKELLWVGGFLARTAYERELADVRDLWNGAIQGTPSDKDQELQSWLQGRALHALKFFTFHQSTPSADVSALLEAAFFSLRTKFRLPSDLHSRSASGIDGTLPRSQIQLPQGTSVVERGRFTCRTTRQCGGTNNTAWWHQDFYEPQEFHSPGWSTSHHLLPITVSKQLAAPSVIASSLPWNELSVAEWLRHICSAAVRGPNAPVAFNLDLSPQWAERVLSVLATAWPSSSKPAKIEIVAILKNVPCIPTSGGLKIPEESYFLKADLFHDLPVVTLPSGTPIRQTLEGVLQALGVRKHVDLQVTGAGEISRKRKAKELYEPIDSLRQLGLDVIDWGQHKWRASSEQAKLLFDLGLMRYPPLDVLISLCAGPNAQIRSTAFKYLLDNLPSRYTDYNPANFYEVSYLPGLQDGKPVMGAPKDVFAVQDWAVFRYLIFVPPSSHPDAALKLKVQQHPPTSRLISLLGTTPPKSEDEARKWFSVLAIRISDFSNTELGRLSQLSMVPTRPVDPKAPAGSLRWLPPTQCFFGSDERSSFHSKLFVFVDFGTAANGFLSACGTKHSPSIEEVSLMLLANPHRFYELANGPSKWVVSQFFHGVSSNSSSTLTKMKKAPILLGTLRKTSATGDLEDDEKDLLYDLKRPDQIVIADDNNALQNFGDSLFTAPQEDILEGFYMILGSRRLSSLVKEEYKTTAESKDQRTAAEIRALILERLPLFLHEHTHARTRVTFNWLNQEAHFIVTSFGKLAVTKTLDFGDIRTSRTQEASAAAKRIGSGPIHLWVATSLNRLLFDSPKTNDALLFMTILSTDLKALKRRGYNVDRILRQQNALRQTAAEEAKIKNAQLMSKPPPSMPATTTADVPMPGNIGTGPTSQPVGADEAMPSSSSAGPILPPPPPPSDSKPRPSSGMFRQLKHKINTTIHPGDRDKSGALPLPPTAPRPRSKAVTPLSNIVSNIDMAIQACRPEAGHLLNNREQMQQVQESLNEGYCDISGRVGDLNVVGEIGSIKVYLSQEVPDPHSFIPSKYDPLSRFVAIIGVLAQVYNVPLTSLHIFYDLDGGLIAFNRNGSIFFNLRYYEAWHDADVKAERNQAAYISWYFTLAHEIAHNLVHPHNSEHEFYFSAIAEKYFPSICARL